ncbi:MAG: ATP-binding protein [Patescibacteria group bacterium]
MDIRVIIKKGVVYFGSIITIIGANGVVIYFNSKYEIISPLWLVIVVMAAGLALFEPLKDFYLKISNKYFFTSLYNYQETIKKTSAEITSTINLNEVITSIFDTIIKTMGLERQAIIVVGEHNHKNKKEHTYNVKKKTGFSDDEINQIIAGEMLVGYLEKHKKGLVVDELHKDIQARKDQGKGTSNLERLETKFKGLKVAICLPLITKGEINGIVVLGNKVSKDAYTVEDLELLETMADQAAVALENARLYEEVQDLNKNLQKKVNEATKEITEKNENLEELLRMKSEFLTVASHQLRTPTSIVRGMLSMLNEPDANKMTKKEKEEFIAQAFAASNNLEHVVHDLLSATELEGGKMKFNIEPLDPTPIIEEVILERQFMADEKGIALKFKKPKKKIQPILVDKYKLHELIANLLDNAIKYTLNGVVEIGLNPTRGKLDIYVKDTGIGLTEDDKEIIFGRFDRGERVLKIQPNGTGLGLYIVKEVIEDMNGSVKAESEGENKGSTFTITLPALIV